MNLKLLDCTLRDGGYINDWKWGFDVSQALIEYLIRAGVDIVEVGFLRNVGDYNKDITVCNRIEELNHLIPANYDSLYSANDTDSSGGYNSYDGSNGSKQSTIFSAMAMCSNYDISKLSPYCGSGIEMIRVTAHDYDIEEGMEFARVVKERGYKLSINPINIMGYSDDRVLWIVDEVNKIQPYQFSIVDTFGSMRRRDLDRLLSMVDHNLDRNIRVGLHLHENMAQSFSLAQQFVDKNLNRLVTVDASLMGIGRTPGNLPIELIADYLNEYLGRNYDIDYLMDAIHDYIEGMKGSNEWGYSPTYFLSARFNLHRNYAEHYQKKGDLTNRDINHLLSRIKKEKSTVFDSGYADRLYDEYKTNIIEDTLDLERIKKELDERKVLILAPGATLKSNEEEIKNFIEEDAPIVISINFVPESYSVDYAFFSNNKRYDILRDTKCKIIATSNLSQEKTDYWINYNSITGSFHQGCNSFIMVLKLLKNLGYDHVYAAGADGYSGNDRDYYKSSMKTEIKRDNSFNQTVKEAIKNVGISVEFITPSAYEVARD